MLQLCMRLGHKGHPRGGKKERRRQEKKGIKGKEEKADGPGKLIFPKLCRKSNFSISKHFIGLKFLLYTPVTRGQPRQSNYSTYLRLFERTPVLNVLFISQTHGQ